MNSSQIFKIIFMIMLVMPFAQAGLVVNKYTNDFTLESPYNEQIKTCACESKSDLLLIKNNGNFQDNYFVEVISPVAEWITIPETEFSLAPGHEKELVVYIEAACDIVGEYEYTIRVVSAYGRVENLHRTIRNDICQNLIVDVNPEEATTNYCTAVDFNVTIENPSAFAEEYHINYGKYDQFINSNKAIYLLPNQEKIIPGSILLPCEFYGTHKIPIIVTAEKNNLEVRDGFVLNVENQFDHSITANTEEKLCSRVTQEIPITIKNELDVSNEYSITLKGTKFVDVKNKERSFELEGLESKKIILEANPNNKDLGDKKLEVIVTSKLGDVSKSKIIDLKVNECFDFNMALPEVSGCCGEKEYAINIRNDGLTTETYNIELDAPEWVIAEEKTISLNPGENKDVNILINMPCIDETFEFPVTVILNSHPEVRETKTLVVNTQTERTCHMVAIENDEFFIKESGVVNFVLEHQGSEGGLYSLEISDELGDLEETFKLYPGETKEFNYSVTGNKGRHIVQPKINIKTDLESIDYIEHLGIELIPESKIIKFFRWFGTLGYCQWSALILLLIAIGAAIFTISARGKELTRLAITRKVLGLILIVLMIAIALTPVKGPVLLGPESPEDFFLVLEPNGNAIIDIEGSFIDADGDSLSYSATQPENLHISFDGSIMTVIAEEGFSGVDSLVIVADDGKGGVEESPELLIYVMKEKELSTAEWWSRYCAPINLSLLLLVALILFIATFLMIEKPTPFVIVGKRVHKRECKLLKRVDEEKKKDSYNKGTYDQCKRCFK